MTHKMLNGIRVELTGAELAEHEEAQRVGHIEAEARRAKRLVQKENRVSTKAKLEALGLTADEIKDTFNL